MGVLLLLRHGQASLGSVNYDELSDLGRRQATLAGRRLAGAELVIDGTVCGALVRQRDTAAQVLMSISAELTVDDRLDEYDHTGVLAAHTSSLSFQTATGESARQFQSALDAAIAHWAAAGRTGGGESHASFIGRVHDVMAELAARPGCTLAVTSGGVIAVATAQLLGLPTDMWPALARVLVNASITKVITGRSGSHLSTFNDHAHLEHDRALVTYR